MSSLDPLTSILVHFYYKMVLITWVQPTISNEYFLVLNLLYFAAAFETLARSF